jgi:four helix bundle protein
VQHAAFGRAGARIRGHGISCDAREAFPWEELQRSLSPCSIFRRNSHGTPDALQGGMARTYKDLVVWQLGNQIRRETLMLLRRPAFSEDWAFRREGRKTASQICRPIPEGFRRHNHGEFAQFLQYSLGSVSELRDFLDDAQERGYVASRDLRPLRRLCFRLGRALVSFIRYLRTNDPPPYWI